MSTRFGEPHVHLVETDSTNERARQLALDGAESGTVITAASQTEGRGRLDRRWSAPPDTALLYSAILRPLDLEHLLLPLAVPVAVCEACEALAPVRCQIKWPNDIWLDGRKLGGVLIEARPPQWAVIGVGVNVSIAPEQFPDDLRWPATSLGDEVEIDALRRKLDEALGRWVEAPPAAVLAEYEARDALRGRAVRWEGGPEPGVERREGTAAGVDEKGNLLVRLADGETVALGSGEVQLRLG